MAIALTRIASYPDIRENVYDVTLDGSYPSGGYAITPANFGMLSIDNVEPVMSDGAGFNPVWVASTGKLKLFKNAAGAGAFTECANTDLTSANKVRCAVTGAPIV